jgi:hypothetical protein
LNAETGALKSGFARFLEISAEKEISSLTISTATTATCKVRSSGDDRALDAAGIKSEWLLAAKQEHRSGGI